MLIRIPIYLACKGVEEVHSYFLVSYLAVDHSPATEHRVVGVLLHGRPANSETHRLEDRANQTINHAYGIMERIDRTSGKIIKLDADRSPEDVPAAVEPRRGLQEAVLRPRVPVRRPGRRRRRLHLHQVLHLFSDEKEGSQREESRVPIPLPRGSSKEMYARRCPSALLS